MSQATHKLSVVVEVGSGLSIGGSRRNALE